MQHLRLATLWRGHWSLLVVLVALRVAVTATWIIQALASARIFATLIRAEPGIDWVDELFSPALVLVSALILRPALVLTGHGVAHRAMSVVKRDLRVRALRALITQSARDPRGRSGRDHALVVDGVENLDAYLSGYLPQLAATVVTVVLVGVTMIVIDPVAGAVASAVALAVPVLPRLWDRMLARRGSDQWEAYQELQAEFVDSMQGMTTLVAFGAETSREQQLASSSAALLARTIAQLRLSLVDSGLASLALIGAPAAVLVVLAVRGGGPSTATIFLLVLLSLELVRPLRDLAALWHAGYVGTFSGSALIALLDQVRPAHDGHGGWQSGEHRYLELRDVVVRHQDATSAALLVERLTLESGMTAIVGQSGAGKSTLAAVAVGLIEAESGSILIDGRACGPGELLEIVSLVPQDPALFGGTVAEEIARGCAHVDGEPDPQVIMDAAREAGIATDDPTLHLASPVGEGGSLLSGGQRQRVAIARALVQGRGILVLDEATSALDPASEAALVARLKRDPNRILVAVTHREAVARIADRIVTVRDGQVDGGQLVHEGRRA